MLPEALLAPESPKFVFPALKLLTSTWLAPDRLKSTVCEELNPSTVAFEAPDSPTLSKSGMVIMALRVTLV